jgi:hypothetical protein
MEAILLELLQKGPCHTIETEKNLIFGWYVFP